MAKIILLHGPNLNLLGTRETNIYGTSTLEQINSKLTQQAQALNHDLLSYQSNAEHELIDQIQNCKSKNIDFIIINPAGYTHTSVALRDALAGVAIPFIEVHLSNPKAREAFRHHSYLEDIAIGGVFGFGVLGYELALQAAHNYLNQTKKDLS